ncbi:hypothetical protein LDENG_00124980 [Lucifuga dentata]|nr:hypothetical protein LDENG_00124980 [Lucifuga dentata]
MVPHTHLKTKSDCAFQTLAPKLWNSLLLTLHSVDSLDSFKRQLKTYLLRQAFG